MTTHYTEGSAHGRFQPFHLGHLEYILAAKKRCDFLWIGITKYETVSGSLTPLGLPREHPHNNPLTYHERVRMITSVLTDAGVPTNEFTFIPFPIENPEKLTMFLPSSIPCFTTICEPWNERKIEVLTESGYVVEVLWRRDKLVSGSQIRDLMLDGSEEWRVLVPAATMKMLDSLEIRQRLLHLHEHAHTEDKT